MTRTTQDSIAAFAEHADEYDALRRRLVPGFDSLYRTAVEVIGLRGGQVRRVLDVGAGTGLLSAQIAGRYPDAHLVLLDGATEMLSYARARLAQHSMEVSERDLRDELPDGEFDAIVSALAIHHLEHDEQKDLLERVHASLRPGGAFVNVEQVAAPSLWLDHQYDAVWRRMCRAAGATDADISRADRRMELDRCVDTHTYIDWMGDAGFIDVDCFYKHWRFAVLAGWRSEP